MELTKEQRETFYVIRRKATKDYAHTFYDGCSQGWGNLFNEEGSLTSDDLKTINWEHLDVKLFRIRDHAETFAAELADRGYVSMTVPFEENFCGNECKELIGATQIVRIQITVEEITGEK